MLVDWNEPVEWVSDGTPISFFLIRKEGNDSAHYGGIDDNDWTMKRPAGYYTSTGGFAGSEKRFDRIRNSVHNPKDFEYDI